MSACGQETCAHWSGDGCACAVFGIDPVCGPCNYGSCADCDTYRRSSSCCCGVLGSGETE